MNASQNKFGRFGSSDEYRFQKMREAGQRRNALIKQKKVDRKNKRNSVTQGPTETDVMMTESLIRQRVEEISERIVQLAMQYAAARRANEEESVIDSNIPDEMRATVEDVTDTIDYVVPEQEEEHDNVQENDEENAENLEAEESEDSDDDASAETEKYETISSATMSDSQMEEDDESESTDRIVLESTNAPSYEKHYEIMQEVLKNMDMDAGKKWAEISKNSDSKDSDDGIKIISSATMNDSQNKIDGSGLSDKDRFQKMREAAERRYETIKQKRANKKAKENDIHNLFSSFFGPRPGGKVPIHPTAPEEIAADPRFAGSKMLAESAARLAAGITRFNPLMPDDVRRDLEDEAKATDVIIPEHEEDYKKMQEALKNGDQEVRDFLI